MRRVCGALLVGMVVLLNGVSGPTRAQDQTAGAVKDAVTTPFSDLNLTGKKVPDVLKAARAAPYSVSGLDNCAGIGDAVQAINTVLGPDLDEPTEGDKNSIIGDAASGAIRSTTSDLIPFRGWVRKLSGAEKRDKSVQAAIDAGKARRAFLKGYGQARGCAWPAAAYVKPKD
ncbi:MAG: hypothetical protein ACK41P_01060 [Asticcacaulis sp.]